MIRFVQLAAVQLALLGQCWWCCINGQHISSEFEWGQRSVRDSVCFSGSFNSNPQYFSWIPIVKLFWFEPNNDVTKVSYIRVWADAPYQRFRAAMLMGGVGSRAPVPTVILVSRPWKLYANVVVYCQL
ncbi:hypothetical protein pipiens_010504 [Culex pipiens pipiens]|uniref:Secreted protein n=1 Tax=Culex pipiens pipiens TaxID=38569 RepID=A0ABD1D9W0_CULPP